MAIGMTGIAKWWPCLVIRPCWIIILVFYIFDFHHNLVVFGWRYQLTLSGNFSLFLHRHRVRAGPREERRKIFHFLDMSPLWYAIQISFSYYYTHNIKYYKWNRQKLYKIIRLMVSWKKVQMKSFIEENDSS